MKFGEYLKAQLNDEWRNSYLDYDQLKKMIKQLEEAFVNNSQNTGEKGAQHKDENKLVDNTVINAFGFFFLGTSLSIPRPTNAAGMPTDRLDAGSITHEHFYAFLEKEMKKIEQFTKDQVCLYTVRI